MPDRRLVVLLVVSMVVALIAAAGAFRMLGRLQRLAPARARQVVVALQDLPEGHVIQPSEVAIRTIPADSWSDSTFTLVDSVVGRTTRYPMFSSEPVVSRRLTPPGSQAGIELKIPAGKRAMAVRIDDVAGLAGLLQPNSRVDVLMTVGEDASRSTAKLIMNNLRVLSVGQQVERGANGEMKDATTATLEVTPREAEKLAVATNQGRIQLALRGYGDSDTITTEGSTVRAVIGMDTARANAGRRSTPAKNTVTAAARRSSPAARVDTSVVRVYKRDQSTSTTLTRRPPPDTSITPLPR